MAEPTDNQLIHAPDELATRLDRLTPAQQAVHNNFLVAVDELKRDLVRTIFYLRTVMDRRIHLLLGFPRIADYAKHYAGLTPRQTQEFLVLGNRLGALPEISAALGRGDLTWSQAREITRAATSENQQELIDLARSVSRQELRERVRTGVLEPEPPPIAGELQLCTPTDSSSSRPREIPVRPRPRPPIRSAPTQPALAPPIADVQHLPFRMTAEQYAVWESLLGARRKQQPGATTVEIVLDALAGTSAAAGALEPSHAPTSRSAR